MVIPELFWWLFCVILESFYIIPGCSEVVLGGSVGVPESFSRWF